MVADQTVRIWRDGRQRACQVASPDLPLRAWRVHLGGARRGARAARAKPAGCYCRRATHPARGAHRTAAMFDSSYGYPHRCGCSAYAPSLHCPLDAQYSGFCPARFPCRVSFARSRWFGAGGREALFVNAPRESGASTALGIFGFYFIFHKIQEGASNAPGFIGGSF